MKVLLTTVLLLSSMAGKRRRPRKRAISARLRRAYPFLCKLRTLPPVGRAVVVIRANRRFFDVLGECCCMVLGGRVPLTSKQQANLRRYKAVIRGISLKSKPIKYQRRVTQKGGFLSALLGAAIPLIGNLLGGLTGR